MKTLAAIGLLIVLSGLLSGCSGGIDISGQGDITSSSGAYNCALEYAPCDFTNTAALKETFTATAREGWTFDYWENCQSAKGSVCEFDVSAEIVSELFGRQLPPLTAHFKPAETGLKVELIRSTITSCDSHETLPYERHCALLIGRAMDVTTRPGIGTFVGGQFANLVFDGGYVETESGWNFTGVYIFDVEGGATHVVNAQRINDQIIVSKYIIGNSNYYIRTISEVTP